MKKSTGLLAVAILMVSLALGLTAVGLATERWLDTVVDRDTIRAEAVATEPDDQDVLDVIDTRPEYYSRNRGLIRTCFPGSELSFLDDLPNAVDGWCLYEGGYELTRRTETLNYGDFYNYRIHLMRAQFVLIGLALLLLLIAAVAIGNGCLTNKASSTKIGAVLAAIAGFFIAVAMAIFHGIEYIENEKITADGSGFRASFSSDDAFKPLARYSKDSYGYSYYVSWIGALTAFIGAIIGLCTSYNMSLEQVGKEDEGMALGPPDRGYDAYNPYEEQGYGPQDMGYPGAVDASYPGYSNYGYDAYNTYGRY